ncbi:hypothetical protein [Streptomyces pilosus]|uniref:hypothetical protein n=1 Tax=Streptomyces pilosus TaxID=28893 RepID=UPI00363DFFD5
MDLEEVNRRARLSIRERDGKFPALFDAVLADAGIEAVLNGVRMPRTNAVMERWVQTRGRELLDRTRDPGSGIRDPGSGISGICSPPCRNSSIFLMCTGPTRAMRTPAR